MAPAVEPTEEVARQPRLGSVPEPTDLAPASTGTTVRLDMIDGWAEVVGPQPPGITLDGRGASTVEVVAASLVGVRLVTDPSVEMVIRGSRLIRCDLSSARLSSVRASILAECKLVGCELSGRLADTELDRCNLSLARLPGTMVERVRFLGCILTDTDLFEASLVDVDFEGSSLAVEADRARFERVDLRHVAALELRNAGSYRGCVITPVQATALALRLAHEAGFDIEIEPPVGGGREPRFLGEGDLRPGAGEG